jgi:hypothetical protein
MFHQLQYAEKSKITGWATKKMDGPACKNPFSLQKQANSCVFISLGPYSGRFFGGLWNKVHQRNQ